MTARFACNLATGVFLSLSPLASAQDECTGKTPENQTQLCDHPVAADTLMPTDSLPPADTSAVVEVVEEKFWDKTTISGGQLTLPFKIRPKAETNSFRLTTDVTLGGYLGLRHRMSDKRNYFLTVPLTAGLTFINLSENSTVGLEAVEAEVVPGLTWSTGLIGKDYASDVQWNYHGRTWWSFGIGFAFVNQ